MLMSLRSPTWIIKLQSSESLFLILQILSVLIMLIVTLSAHLLATGIPRKAKHMAEPGLQQTLDATEGLVSEVCLHTRCFCT